MPEEEVIISHRTDWSHITQVMDENGLYTNEISIYSGLGQTWLKETFNADTGKLIKSSNYHLSEILNDETWSNMT